MDEHAFYNALLDEVTDDEISNSDDESIKEVVVSNEINIKNCSIYELGVLTILQYESKIALKFDGYSEYITFFNNDSNVFKMRGELDGYSFVFKYDNEVKGHMDIIKNKNTEKDQWKMFEEFVQKVIKFKHNPKSTTNFEEFVSDIDEQLKFECQCNTRTAKNNTAIITFNNNIFKIQLDGNEKSWIIDKSIKICCITYETGIVFYYSGKSMKKHFGLYCENAADKKEVIKIFKNFVNCNNEDEEIDELINFQNDEIEYVKGIEENEEEEIIDDHSLAPRTGGIIFPLSSGKKRFSYHVGCNISTEVLELWFKENIHKQPPPHWRDHPQANIVRQEFIEGDPIEEDREQKKYEYQPRRTMKSVTNKNILVSYEEIVSTDIVYQENVANVLCIAQDLHPDYLTILSSALSQPLSKNQLTPTMKKMLQYDYGRNSKRAAKKFKAAASIEYIEKMQECIVPIFTEINAEIVCDAEEAPSTLKYYTFYIECNKEFDTSGQFLIVKSESLKLQDTIYVYHAYCYKTENGYKFIAPNQDECKRFKQIEIITIYRKPSTREFENMCRLSRDLFKMDEIAQKIFDTTDDPPVNPIPYPVTVTQPLNDTQELAVKGLLNQHPRNVFVLFGPPGTGKTYTLITAIEAIKKAFDKRNKKLCVLVCTHSNMAADNFAIALIKAGIFENHQMFRSISSRLSNTPRHPSIYPITKRDKGKYYIPKNRTWRDKLYVVICIIGHHRCLLKLFGIDYFTHIYIDEAGQARDAEVIMPLFTFGSKNTLFAIAGDPKQLDPVITSEILRNPEYNTKLSTISRINDHPEYTEFRKNVKNFVILNTNYRSQMHISNLVSFLIYENILISNIPSDCNDFIGYSLLPNKAIPIVFCAINGKEERVGTSYKNEREVLQIILTIENILTNINMKQSDIGVVTPYKANVYAIKKKLWLQYPEVNVDSVEKYQGSEREVIIISTVRTESLGFLNDPKRLCTAISRPRKLLFIIGCPKILIQDEKWKEMIKYLYESECVIPAKNNSFWCGIF
uniref:RNA helicase n=1 Tax=Panagrolaimus sp. ES5 TaxID=591445 RepID=A0AC34F7V7_9BILA